MWCYGSHFSISFSTHGDQLTERTGRMISESNTSSNEHYLPVHRHRKFLLVFGHISEKSWKTMRPTARHRRNKLAEESFLLAATENYKCWINVTKKTQLTKSFNRPRIHLSRPNSTMLCTFNWLPTKNYKDPVAKLRRYRNFLVARGKSRL